MNDPFANKGFKMLTGTSAIPLDPPIMGLTPVGGDLVIAAITHPSSADNGVTAYSGDAAILGVTLKEGVFYPIKATSITLTSGSAIGWLA